MITALVILALVLVAAAGLPNLIQYRKVKINVKAKAMSQEKIFDDV